MTDKQKEQYKRMIDNTNKKYIGQKYNRLTIISYNSIKNNHRYYNCRCDCGNIKVVDIKHLKGGKIKSCGCLWEENKHEYRKIHGFSNKEHLYSTWKGIKHRCYCKTAKRYKDYGGRGITMCEDWKNSYISFRDWAINNGWIEGLTIDRIDNDKGYYPENCRFVTYKEQNRNQRSNVFLSYNGKTMILADWEKETGISRETISARINRLHWSIEKALTTKVGK